ncbi:MAG: 6-bladed beta-propeller [Chitinophagaceae bacterium]
MQRRQFITQSAGSVAGLLIMHDLFARKSEPIFGHNQMRFTLDTQWSKADPMKFPVNDCHEMVQDSKGRIILLTNETKNNLLVYNTKGKILESWGHDFPGAHGLTLHNENGVEYLYITDTNKHEVYKVSLDGKILLTIKTPLDANGIYTKNEQFVPTETIIDDNGDIFIADGYGLQYILHYDNKGNLKSYFGGKGEGDAHLDNAHGITIDRRNGSKNLLITDRTRNCFKQFSMDGAYLSKIEIPGACVCRPVIHGDYIYAAVLRSPDLGAEGTGFVTIIDKNNKVISNIGGTEPIYKDGKLLPLSQAQKIFNHPHDVCVDRDDNLYVAQWASGKVYPYKLKRV